MSYSLKLINYAVLRDSQARKIPDGSQFTMKKGAMNAILKYHL